MYLYSNGHNRYRHFPCQGRPKFTQIGIFGLKIYHLATLGRSLAIRSFRFYAYLKDNPNISYFKIYQVFLGICSNQFLLCIPKANPSCTYVQKNKFENCSKFSSQNDTTLSYIKPKLYTY
jgi:hypothetical protein